MPEETWLNDFVFLVRDLFSGEECGELIRLSEDIGFEEALVSSPQGQVLRKDVRNNQRVMIQSEELAERLWRRAVDYIPAEIDGRQAIGVNELLRFYRYDVGQQFNWHQDFAFERDNGERSCLTYMLYLNDGFEGGETAFEDSYSDESFDEFKVVPEVGMGLFFVHGTHHRGESVTRGRKYVLRTDVMFGADADDSGEVGAGSGDGFGDDSGDDSGEDW